MIGFSAIPSRLTHQEAQPMILQLARKIAQRITRRAPDFIVGGRTCINCAERIRKHLQGNNHG